MQINLEEFIKYSFDSLQVSTYLFEKSKLTSQTHCWTINQSQVNTKVHD